MSQPSDDEKLIRAVAVLAFVTWVISPNHSRFTNWVLDRVARRRKGDDESAGG